MSDCWACQARMRLEASLNERMAAIAERYALQMSASAHLDRSVERKAREEMEAMASPMRDEIAKLLERCHCARRWGTLDDRPGSMHIEADEGVEAVRGVESAIVVEERPSFQLPDGPPLRGICSACGSDLDALRRRGVIGHACFGPGDIVNTEEAS